MARITVEDCLDHVENRFELVLKASERAHALELGAVDSMVPIENDKPTVLALREIAAGYDVSELKGSKEEEVEEKVQEKPASETDTVSEAISSSSQSNSDS